MSRVELRVILFRAVLELFWMPIKVSSDPSYVPPAIPALGPAAIEVPLSVIVIVMSQPAVAVPIAGHIATANATLGATTPSAGCYCCM